MIKGLDTESLKKLLRNVYINENPKWHSERNSLVHIKIVMSRGLQTKDTDLSKAALYHDIAKFDTVSFNKAGWPTSLGHDKAGAEVAKADGCDDMVVYICAKHMVIKGWLASATGGPSEGGELNPNTKFKIFAEAPGADNNEKAKAFWKLCVFSKMDNMGNDFNAESLKWDNPSYDKWDEECPLRDQFKKSELVEIKAEKAPVLFTAQEIMKFGAKGPQIGQINKEISGKTKEEAFEIIKKILGNPDLTMESKRWIKTFESFRMSRINEEFLGLGGLDVEVGDVFGFSLQKKGQDIEQEIISSLKENEVIKKIISDWSNRFKSSIEKGEITNNQTQTLSGKIYQAAKGIIDVEKGLGLPNSYTYGSILKDVINNKMSDITGIKNIRSGW
jgi:hypothetical protein